MLLRRGVIKVLIKRPARYIAQREELDVVKSN